MTNSNKFEPPSSGTRSQVSSPLITLMQLHPLVPPRFPKWSELLEKETPSEKSSPRRGLFSDLVGNPEVILDDLLRRPKIYEEGVAELLQELVTGRKTLAGLSQSEMDLLDRATLDLNSSRRPLEKTAMKKKATPSEVDEDVALSEDGDLGAAMPEDLIPDVAMIPSWFL
jgi:hypothetical protein